MARMIPLYSASSQAEIERRARELFEQAGRPAGHDLEIWLCAEADYRQGLHDSLNSPGQISPRPALPPEN